jgi:uncharacterized coiled-coil DUF342 family protein
MARKTAGEELSKLEGLIDEIDNEMQELRLQIASAQTRKDEIVGRHGRIRKAYVHLSAAIDDVDATVDEQ